MSRVAAAAAATWMRKHAGELAQFETAATEGSVTQMGMTFAMTDQGYSEVDPFDRIECELDGSNPNNPWLCIPEEELPPVESFDFLL
jgi:hypothetical protein|tara:strand:- start:112 stop:372 length:261 start_codon:yes stop_codon:yes gene_type:complete